MLHDAFPQILEYFFKGDGARILEDTANLLATSRKNSLKV